ncbi:MAG: CxxxxCH/CxxCH domain-containing protein [Fimbriimonadaceae bacterium]|nr:CxxxxCH/CxxCH domain-containing protein [Fimbriimonadaceae bacterium]
MPRRAVRKGCAPCSRWPRSACGPRSKGSPPKAFRPSPTWPSPRATGCRSCHGTLGGSSRIRSQCPRMTRRCCLRPLAG